MRIVFAALIGGVVLFLYGMISWMGLPFHTAALHTLPGDPAQVDAWLRAVPAAGVYHYPGFPHNPDGSPVTDAQMNECMERMRRGPVVSLMVVHPKGVDPMAGSTFALSFAQNCAAALVAAILLSIASPALRRYWQRALFVWGLGVFAMFNSYLPAALWWGYSADFVAADLLDALLAPLLAGLAIATVLRPRRVGVTENS